MNKKCTEIDSNLKIVLKYNKKFNFLFTHPLKNQLQTFLYKKVVEYRCQKKAVEKLIDKT